MRKTKLLSTVTAIVMSICMMLGTFSTASACSNCNPPSDVVHGMGDLPIYFTLEELFEMSDEEFFALPNAKEYYDEVKSDSERFVQVSEIKEYGGISGMVWTWLYEEDENVKYTANVTEMEIEELLGDTVKYEIDSPISLDVDYLMDNLLYYGNIFWVNFPDYNLYSQTDNITHKEIVEFTKCWYCVNQVIDINYYHYGWVLSPAPGDEQVITGDVNFDKNVNILDAIWIAKGLIKQYKLTAAQLKIADINNDDNVNVFDVILLMRKVMSI